MPQGFQVGPVFIRFYALIIIFGAMVGAWVASNQARRAGKNGDEMWDLLPWLLIGGIIGARLWHVFTPSASNAAAGLTTQYYLSHPLEILMMWKGGLGIPGGVIGGAIALMIYSKVKKHHFMEWADLIAPGLLFAQAIGRWGNFVNQELYGGPSDLPWAISTDPQYRLPGFENVERYHPMFFYEFVLNILAGLFLLWASRKWKDKLYRGDLFLGYLVLYPVIRFLLEFMRLDPSPVAGFNVNQTFMAVVAVIAGGILLYRHFVKAPTIEPDEIEVDLDSDQAGELEGEDVLDLEHEMVSAEEQEALEDLEKLEDELDETIETFRSDAEELAADADLEEITDEDELELTHLAFNEDVFDSDLDDESEDDELA